MSLQPQYYLLTICDLAVGFTGFISLVLALAPRRHVPPAVFRFRAYSLLASSLGCLFLALTSLGLLSFELSETEVWRWSSAAAAFYAGASIPLAMPLARRARAEARESSRYSESIIAVALQWIPTPLNTIMLTLNAAHMLPSPFSVYFFGLVLFLGYAGIGLVLALVDAVQGADAVQQADEADAE